MKKIKANHYIETAIYSADKILKILKAELKQKLDKLNIGITGEQFVVLDTISYLEHEDIYQQKLSEIIMKDKSNTNRILKVLEQKGLIKKEMGNVNNRLVYFIRLTDSGKEIIDNNVPRMKQFITDIFENITDEEVENLHYLSKKFQNDLSSL